MKKELLSVEFSGRQVGDPAKAAQAMLKVAMSDDPPAHLLLGSDAVRFVEEQLASRQVEVAAWKDVSLATDAT